MRFVEAICEEGKMLGLNEIDILKALVEEELFSSNATADNSTTILIGNYRHTLSGIVKKLHGMQGHCAKGFSKRSALNCSCRG